MPARILIIEDNAANLELVKYLLESAGHTTLCSMDGEEGVSVARRELPDLVLCDLQMPLLDGYGVLQELRASAECSRVAVVAITAFSMQGDDQRVLTAGFDGYLAKPIDPERFVEQIEGFLSLIPHDKSLSTDARGAAPDHG